PQSTSVSSPFCTPSEQVAGSVGPASGSTPLSGSVVPPSPSSTPESSSVPLSGSVLPPSMSVPLSMSVPASSSSTPASMSVMALSGSTGWPLSLPGPAVSPSTGGGPSQATSRAAQVRASPIQGIRISIIEVTSVTNAPRPDGLHDER